MTRRAILSGPVGVGKTTVCTRIVAAARRRGCDVRGVLSVPELDSKGNRVAVRLLDLRSGAQQELARLDRRLDGPCIGSYSFCSEALDRGQHVLAAALAAPCDLVVIDEIGRLELERNEGFATSLPLLAAMHSAALLIVVRDFLLPAFTRTVGSDYATFTVTLQNRDYLPDQVARFLLSGLSAIAR